MEVSGKAVLWVAVLAGLVFGVHSCATSQWWEAQEKADAAERAAREKWETTPHEIAHDAQGCRTMQFRRGDHWHTYTACPQAVTTHEDAWDTTERQGKQTVTKHHKAEIVTTA